MSQKSLKLQGQFKFDVFGASGNLIRSSDWIDNFITNSGVTYPYYFAFADCFRYLSLGYEASPTMNSTGLSMPETTGLSGPLIDYSFIGSGNYTNQLFFGGGCGNIQNPDGVSLVRQWTLPDENGGTFVSDQLFSEVMVSPGKPLDFGPDDSSIATYYHWLTTINEGSRKRIELSGACAAFSRVVPPTPLSVLAGEVLTVTYKLNISINTGIVLNSFNTTTSAVDGNWSEFSFLANVTQPGVKLINDGFTAAQIAPNGRVRLQHYDYHNYPANQYAFPQEYGESYVPAMGIPLEPSCVYGPEGNISIYLSEDNFQFLVSPSGGAVQDTGSYLPWSPTGQNLYWHSGLKSFSNDNIAAQEDNYWTQSFNHFNIRTSTGNYPNTGNIQGAVNSSPKIFRVTSLADVPLFTNGRSGQVSSAYSFRSIAGTTIYAKSIVSSYADLSFTDVTNLGRGDYVNQIPFYDCLISGISGSNIFLPTIATGTEWFGGATGGVISGAHSLDYNYLTRTSNSLFPDFTTALTWSAPCPFGVDGC